MQEPQLDTLRFEEAIDTIIVPVEIPVRSLFENHLLIPENGIVVLERSASSNLLVLSILLICAFLVVYVQRNSEGVIGSVIKAAFDRNLANQDSRIENSQRTRNLFLLKIMSVISIALFIALGLTKTIITDQYIGLTFLQSLGIFLAIWIGKRAIQFLLSIVFDLNQEFRVHRYSVNVLMMVIGLALLPLSLTLAYTPQILPLSIVYVGIGLVVFMYLKGLLRSLMLSLNSPSVSTLHLFYYFCALEILPVSVLIRTALNM